MWGFPSYSQGEDRMTDHEMKSPQQTKRSKLQPTATAKPVSRNQACFSFQLHGYFAHPNGVGLRSTSSYPVLCMVCLDAGARAMLSRCGLLLKAPLM